MTKQQRREEVKYILETLKDDLYERDREYPPREGREPVVPIEIDHENEMIWGSPLAWRVVIGYNQQDEDQFIHVRTYDFKGELYKEVKSHNHLEVYSQLDYLVP